MNDASNNTYCPYYPADEDPSCVRMNTTNSFPSIAGAFCKTRLGNQLSAFASMYSLWRRFGIYNYITRDQYKRLNTVFDLPNDKSKCVDDWPYFVWKQSKYIPQLFAFMISKRCIIIKRFIVN